MCLPKHLCVVQSDHRIDALIRSAAISSQKKNHSRITQSSGKPENPTAAHVSSDVASIIPTKILFIDIYKGGLSSRVSYLAFDRSEISSVPQRGATDDDDVVTGSLRGVGSSCVQAATAGMILPNTAHCIYNPFPLHVQACKEEQACLFASQLRLPKKKRKKDMCKIAKHSSNPGKAQRCISNQ